MEKEVTMRELARLLNLSVSTVSKSLSDNHEISKRTKKRVIEVAEALNYKPNYFASKLRRGTPKVIGVILPTILNPFYARLLTGIELTLSEQGYKMLALFSNDSQNKEIQCISQLADGSIGGLIVCMAKETQLTKSKHHLTTWNNTNTETVYVDRFDGSLLKDQVVSNDYESTYKVCHDLIQNSSCKYIVFASLMGKLTIEKLRYQGYKMAMSEKDLGKKIKTIRTRESLVFRQKLTSLIKQDRVDAIICTNESTINEVLHLFKNDHKLKTSKIPLVGFCGEHLKTLSEYPHLSIIDQNAADLGKQAAKTLLKRISAKRPRAYRVYQVKSRILK